MGYTKEGIGFQNSDTSETAANYNVKGKVTIREQVKRLFAVNDMLTVEDVSRMLQKPEISVQPRVTELKNDGFLCDSGLRREGKWGTKITVWARQKGQMDLL